ncbi:hypothetical protein O3G_MSEX012901 [Manduca sexta]|uniref:Uncharacterized protein n=1 Tax=Manduca sexta TaxID=7130 RepID=A0A921ZQN1_MANSE|nr:hypothetical protein O3G_MSEX012901 [Manduca sexta]
MITGRSWWRQLGENSRDVMEVIESNKVSAETDNVEELIEMEVLSQEKEDYHLDLPESSGSESIHSIVMPQRKLFKLKENDAPKMFGQIVGNRETLPKLHKSSVGHDKSIKVGPRELFQNNKQRTKPIFPAALLDISLNKTVSDKTKENLMEPPKNQVRNIFGNHAPTKRRNMFAEFVVSESEDEIPEIQPKVFSFPKKSDPKRRGSSTSRGMREPSPASSITTDMEMDDWKQLPSSTMVAEQLEEAMSRTPVKRARLSKLSEAKESDTGTNSNATGDKTKQSNKSISSKNKSKNSSTIKDKSLELNNSMTTKHAARNMQNNFIVDNITHEASFTSKNMSNNKSKSSNSSLNKRNSKKAEQSLSADNNKSQISEKSKQNISNSKKRLHTDGSQLVEQDNNLENVIEQDENNAEIDENEENNFTLEYESDEQQGTVAQNVENKSAKNKTVTLKKDSDKTHNAVASPEKQNTSVKQLHSISKKIVNETDESDIVKETEATLIDTNIIGANIIPVNVDASKTISDVCKANIDNRNNVVENNDMEFDEQDVNRFENKEVHEEMDIDEIDERIVKNKDIISISVKKSSTNEEVSNQNQSDYHNSKKILESQKANQTNVENKQVSIIKKLLNENDGKNESVEINAENSRVILNENNDKAEKDRQEIRVEESTEDFEELQNKTLYSNKTQELNISNKKDEDNSNRDIRNESQQEQNESNITKDKMDVEEEIENEATEHNESNAVEFNGSEMSEHDKNKVEEQNESETVEQDDNTAEKQNESEIEERNESKDEEQNDSEEIEQDESDAEEQNESEIIEQHESDSEEHNENEADAQNDSQILEHDISEEEQRSESEVEEQNENEANEQNESEPEEQNESEAEEQEESDAEEHIESEFEEQNESDAEEQIESELKEQNESDAEEQNESEGEDQNESEAEEENEGEEELRDQSQEASEDVIERTETPNLSGIKSPEAVLHDQTNRGDSFTAKGRNTSVRKSKSMIKPLNIRPSLAPPRDSIGFSDGTKNSTAEGSGWDSHRTTRKTLRQTFGRDFSPRKSLRALVMEKSAKRQTAYMDRRPDITSLPQANSTEFPEMSNRDYEETMESDHELSRRTRQATLEMCLEQIKTKNLERWERVGDQVRNMFKTSNKENVRFKEPRPMFETIRKTKPVKTKSKDKQLGLLMPLDYLPSELLKDMTYKPPKRFQPGNVSWITKRLYKFLETKLEPKYDYKARVRAEKLVETIYNFAKGLKRHQVAPIDAVEVLKHEMARLDIVKTHFEFYEFIKNYMPREIRIKVIPDIVNKIPMPKHGIFSEILLH